MKKASSSGGAGAAIKTNRTLIVILCIVVALVLVFLISPLLQKSTGGTMEIIRLARDVARGDMITEADIETVSVGTAGLPTDNPKIWLDPSQKNAILKGGANGGGMYAAGNLYKGDYFNEDKLLKDSSATINAPDAFANDLNGTKVAISISAGNYAQMLSGKLMNGDIVSLIINPENNPNNTAIIPPEFRYVQILTTTTEKGYDRDNVPRNEDGTIDGAVTITVIVRREQAQLLAYLEEHTRVHCALVCRGTDPRAKAYLEEQDRWLDQEYGTVDNHFTINEDPSYTAEYLQNVGNDYSQNANGEAEETAVNR